MLRKVLITQYRWQRYKWSNMCARSCILFPLMPQVFEEQVGDTETSTYWRDRKSMIAVCDEIGMENIPVTKVNEKDPERLMKSRPADAQLYGATVCARLGWQTNCFQVLSTKKNRWSSKYNAVIFLDSRYTWFGCRYSFQLRISLP